MPLDVLGCTRVTLESSECFFLLRHKWVTMKFSSWLGSELAIILRERGIPSKHYFIRMCDYVPVLCTHRPSLLLIECFSEIFGLVFRATLGSFGLYRKDAQTGSFRGSKSRNKVFVGEPAMDHYRFWLMNYSIQSSTKHFYFAQSFIHSLHVMIVSHHYVI